MSTDMIANSVQNMPDVTIVRRIQSKGLGAFSLFGAGIGGTDGTIMPEVIVAEMPVGRGEALKASAPPQIVVEEDRLLNHHADNGDFFTQMVNATLQATVLPPAAAAEVQLRIVGVNNQPIPKATVYLYANGFPTQGVTDGSGSVTLAVSGGAIESVQAIYIKPKVDYWERFIKQPGLVAAAPNTIQLTPLSQTFQNFPQTSITGWGDKLMGLDQVAQGLTGRGVKIGIIDSGCDNTHPQLTHVRQGLDFTNGRDPASWIRDEMSHGTHCAGVIGAASGDARGIRGFAPEAEIHAFKVFPGGRFSDLIDALDECIQRGIDVVNMSLGSGTVSELVAQKIAEARSQGVACIVAAGNSGGPVQFPGTLPSVLSVSAVGQIGTFPEDTFHAQSVLPNPGGTPGIFPAKFSCFGPNIGVCGPGVAIVSCVPGGYAAWDGTSMATPHVTGLVALILAHHPVFQGPAKARSDARVMQLFQIIRAVSAPVVTDATRGGAGMPSLQALLGAGAGALPQQPQKPDTMSAPGIAGSQQPIAAGLGGGAIGQLNDQQVAAALLANLAAIQNWASLAQLQRLAQLRSLGLI